MSPGHDVSAFSVEFGVGRLAVVDEQHAPEPTNALHAVRQAGERAEGRDMIGQGHIRQHQRRDRERGERVLHVVASAQRLDPDKAADVHLERIDRGEVQMVVLAIEQRNIAGARTEAADRGDRDPVLRDAIGNGGTQSVIDTDHGAAARATRLSLMAT